MYRNSQTPKEVAPNSQKKRKNWSAPGIDGVQNF